MKLISDFSEIYDNFFTNYGKPFYRMTNRGLCKRDQLKFLENLGLQVPEHGLVKDLLTTVSLVVVYLDEKKHCGEGKIIANYDDTKVRTILYSI